MDNLRSWSLHYYTLTLKDGDWQHKGSATEFSRCELYEALRQAMRMEEMVENHGRIIRRFAKGKNIGLVVDEWGTWFDVEPGTNPGFLYQQNTMRDALVAALTLNIFNNHCDTVVMANIAQIANVLQSMVLTEGDKLLLIYAQDIIEPLAKRGEHPVVVSEVKCSQVLYDTIDAMGGKAIMTKTGHGYIKSKMKETNAILAGEMSGHTFFKDRYYGFDDAIYAGCRIIEIIAKQKLQNPDFKIENLLKPFDGVCTSKEVRFRCPNDFKKPVLEDMKKAVADNPDLFGTKIKDIITLDGMRIILEDGFAMIRQSNTEPVFTLRFEAKSQENCKHYEDTFVALLDKTVKKYC